MRTTIDIPDDLMEEAWRLSRSATKRDTIIAGLKELIRTAHLQELMRLPGTMEIDLDLDVSRGRKKSRENLREQKQV